MKKTLTLLVASTALTAAIGLPAWSAMHVARRPKPSALRGALRRRGRRRCPSSSPATMTTTTTAAAVQSSRRGHDDDDDDERR